MPIRIEWAVLLCLVTVPSVSGAEPMPAQLHVSGNMHCDPLVYFRTEQAGDITTLKRQGMTGD